MTPSLFNILAIIIAPNLRPRDFKYAGRIFHIMPVFTPINHGTQVKLNCFKMHKLTKDKPICSRPVTRVAKVIASTEGSRSTSVMIFEIFAASIFADYSFPKHSKFESNFASGKDFKSSGFQCPVHPRHRAEIRCIFFAINDGNGMYWFKLRSFEHVFQNIDINQRTRIIFGRAKLGIWNVHSPSDMACRKFIFFVNTKTVTKDIQDSHICLALRLHHFCRRKKGV